MQPMLSSPGTGVIVTGGASGLGRASAHALAAVGRPVAVWDIDGARAQATAEELRAAYGATAIGIGLDIADPSAYAAAIERSREALVSIGGLVHAAGVVDMGSLEGVTTESWDRGIAIHLRPVPCWPGRCCRSSRRIRVRRSSRSHRSTPRSATR